MSETITLEIRPLDVLFFRDGRPFDAAAQVRSGLPTPQVLAGALRSWLLQLAGCDFAALSARIRAGAGFAKALDGQMDKVRAVGSLRVRGPWFARADGLPLVPVPAILRQPKSKSSDGTDGPLARLAPLQPPPPGWPDPHGLRPLWAGVPGALEPVGGWLTLDGLKRFLEGTVPDRGEIVPAGALYGHDRRVSVAIAGDTLTGREGQIFSAGFLALDQGVHLLAELVIPKNTRVKVPKRAVVPLGGEGRRVEVRQRRAPIPWPKLPPAAGKRLLLLIAPALFADGWRPSGLEPLAAAVPRPEPVSGWDLARGGPKPTRFAVPAGAVYFLDAPPPPSPAADGPGALGAPEDTAAGWGTFLEGVWS